MKKKTIHYGKGAVFSATREKMKTTMKASVKSVCIALIFTLMIIMTSGCAITRPLEKERKEVIRICENVINYKLSRDEASKQLDNIVSLTSDDYSFFKSCVDVLKSCMVNRNCDAGDIRKAIYVFSNIDFLNEAYKDSFCLRTNNDSMIPVFKSGDLIRCVPVDDASKLKPGDIIAFWTIIGGKRDVDTHRIVQVFDGGGYLIFETKGDNSTMIDNLTVHESEIIGLYCETLTPA